MKLSRRGLTLASVMAAAAVLAIALTMTTSAFISAARLTACAANLTAASNFVEGVMERTISMPFDRVASVQVTADLPELPQARCRVEVTPHGERLKEVSVICDWVENGRPRKVTLSTLVARGGLR